MKKFHLQIAAPDGLRYDGDAVQISVRGIEGDFAVLAGHIPFVTALKAGECRVYVGENGDTIRCAPSSSASSRSCVITAISAFPEFARI